MGGCSDFGTLLDFGWLCLGGVGLWRLGLGVVEAFAICSGVYVGKGSHRFAYLYEMGVRAKVLGTQ